MSLKAELAVANHILFKQRVVDGFGHVSVRDPDNPERFFLSRSMAPALVTEGDIITFGPDGEAIGDDRKAYLERYIHSEIYRARPEVMSVVHSHSAAVIPFGLVRSMPLRPVCHMCGFVHSAGAPVFEIRDYAGDSSNLLVDSRALGKNLTEVMGGENAVLMRGHGSTVVGRNLREAVFRGVYLEVNARLQAEALRLGEPTYMTDGEAASVDAMNAATLERAWGLWVREAEGA
jgi:HCOMODA/2-hydroxy-3-carboxy-muconic semialdehyde decarboxylase